MLNKNLKGLFSCLAFAFMAVSTVVNSAENKLLNLPADISHRAVNSVMLGMERAGSRLITIGERGFILFSDDQGKSWQQAKVPVSVTLTAVDFATSERGWAVGHGGVVLRTDDAGETWVKKLDGVVAAQIEMDAAQAAYNPKSRRSKFRLREAKFSVKGGADKPFLSVHFTDENNGMVVGAYGFAFATDDGGENWYSIMGQVPNMMGMHLYDIHVERDHTFLLGEQGSLFRRTDGEESFERLETPYEGSFFGMTASTEADLLLYGLRGHLFRSTDDGDQWKQIPLPLPVTLTSGIQLKDGGIILTDETGQVFLSRDNGASFKPIQVDSPSVFTGVVESVDGDLLFSGIRGISRVGTDNLNIEVAGNE